MKRALRTLLDRDALDADMDAEMRHHIELETKELIDNGLSPSEARRQAAIAFGGVDRQKEQSIDDSGVAWLIDLRRDVRIAVKTVRRYPTFAITATLALSLAIAVNTTMFSILDAMIHPRAGARRPEQLYTVKYFGDVRRKVDFRESAAALAAAGRMFGAITQYASKGQTIQRGSFYQEAKVIVARPNFFTLLGVQPIAGRLSPGGDDQSIHASLVISDRLAASFYARGESPLGTQILLDDIPHTVIGVTTRYSGMNGLDQDVWAFAAENEQLYGVRLLRLNDDVTLDQAKERLKTLAAQLAQAAGDPTRDTRFYLEPMVQQFHADRFHYALVGAGIAILLVACTNLANLQLARGLGRSSELALRASLGASRRQIIAQLVIESALLAAGALLLALSLTIVGNALVRATVPESIGNYVVEPHFSWRMIAFAAIAAVACVIAVGLIPALRVSRVELNEMLKRRAGTGAHKSNRRVYGMLVIAQIAFTLPLVSAATLTTRAAARASSIDYLVRESFGYDPTPLMSVVLRLAVDSARPVPIADLTTTFVERARAVQGVNDAATSRIGLASSLTMDGPDGGFKMLPTPMWTYMVVSPAYFRTMGYPMEEGKDFSDGGHTEPGVIVDRQTADYLWPGQPVVGRLIKFGDARSNEPYLRIQGVVGDRLTPEARDRRRAARLTRLGAVYRVMTVGDTEPKPRDGSTFLMLTVKANHEPHRVAIALRRALEEGTLMQPSVQLQADYLGINRERTVTTFVAGLFTTFGVLALVLSALGVYAIVAQSVVDRKREVAVRIALGANPKQIIRALLREGNALVLAGVAIGLYMAKETIAWLGMFLGENDMTNAPLFALICVALFAMMVGAALVPAMKATQLDPMDVLRAE
ncbi:MAG: FtsX-like permease family protein [Gemmatimonadaceae bacterium]